jgi:hypothetical protein
MGRDALQMFEIFLVASNRCLCHSSVLTSSVGLVSPFLDTTYVLRLLHFLVPVEYGYLITLLCVVPLGSIYNPRAFIPR